MKRKGAKPFEPFIVNKPSDRVAFVFRGSSGRPIYVEDKRNVADKKH